MTISLTPSTPDDSANGPRSIAGLAYYRTQYRYRLHQALIDEFLRQEEKGLISRSELAERVRRDKAQITRWLAAPTNYEADTISDLLYGMNKKLAVLVVDLESDLSVYPTQWNSPVRLAFLDSAAQSRNARFYNVEFTEMTGPSTAQRSRFIRYMGLVAHAQGHVPAQAFQPSVPTQPY